MSLFEKFRLIPERIACTYNSWSTFLATELGTPFNIVNDSIVLTNVYDSETFKQMPVYPKEGYIQIIDDMVVIK